MYFPVEDLESHEALSPKILLLLYCSSKRVIGFVVPFLIPRGVFEAEIPSRFDSDTYMVRKLSIDRLNIL